MPERIVDHSIHRPTADLRECARSAGGNAAVEFALVLPVFLALLLGIVAYGIYFGATNSTAQLAADAARASVAGLTDQERSAIARAHVRLNAASYPLLDPSLIEVEAGALPADATQFRVTVSYDASQLPIWSFARVLALPSETIARTSTVKRGGY